MRKIILLLVLVVVVACGLAAASLRSRVAGAAPAVARDIADKLGVSVDLGDIHVSLFPPAAKVDNVRVARREQASRPFLTIPSLRFDAAPLSLFSGALDIREVVAEKPHLEMMRDPDGRLQSSLADEFLQKLAKVAFAVRIVDGSLLAEDGTVDPPRRLTAEGVDGTVSGAADGGLVATLEGSVLGSSDASKLSLKLVPGAGKTGGDSLTVDFAISDGTAAALKDAFVILRKVEFADPVALHFQASGLYGEKSTETVPAEALPGKLDGSVGVRIGGVEDRLTFETEVAIDDARYQVRRGKGRWRDFAFEPTGWVTIKAPHKVSARLAFERVALATAAERFGFEERWWPKGEVDFAIRATGSTDELLIRHEGKVDAVEFNGFPGLPVKAAPLTFMGALLAINTDMSVSFAASNLEVGTAHFDKELIGLNYYHDKLTLTSLDAPVYDGVANGSVAFYPTTAEKVEGGIMYRDSDAEVVLSNLTPNLALDIYGRSDGVAELRQGDAGEFSVRGRIAFHRGRIAGSNWMRQLVGEALTVAGRGNALASVAADAASTLADGGGTRFERIAVDFETPGGDAKLPRVVIDADAASIRGRGTLGADGAISIEGALLPRETLGRALVAAAPSLASAKSAKGALAIPFTLRADSTGTQLAATPAFRDAVAAALAGKPAAPLDIIEVGPKDFGPTLTLRQQFGR